MSLEYLLNLLKTREPKPKYAEIIREKKELHYKRMAEEVHDDIEELPIESFMKTLEVLQKRPDNKYDFITKSGSSLKAALFKLFQIIWKTEQIPEAWHESLVTQLFKGRGKLSDLSNMRHIHDRNQTGKFFSQIVLHHAKDNLLKNMSKFQLACKPGHRPSEHLFVLKSVFTQYKQNKKGLLCTSYDISTFFDSEDVFDVFGEVYNNQVKGKVYRLLFEMNKNTRVKINTPVGVSQSADTGPTVTQGSVESGILSSVSIDNGTNVTFAQSEVEVMYKSLKLGPTIFMDDLARMAATLASAQYGNNLMQELIEQKCLEFNCY